MCAAAAKLPTGPVRDLFEGNLAVPEQGPRKLGSNPRPKSILAMQGDSSRGEQLFWSQGMNCGKCHRIGERGTAVGPDLSTIGKQRSSEELLESLLWPSRRIDPKFAAYVLIMVDGRAFAGLLLKRDANAIVLWDNQGKEVKVAAAELQELHPSRISLMPDGQLAELTPQEAADLLEYLKTRR